MACGKALSLTNPRSPPAAEVDDSDHCLAISGNGAPLSTEEWERRKRDWLPAPSDREYLLSIMATPVYAPGKFANYIAPPIRGINRQDVNFEYVRTEL